MLDSSLLHYLLSSDIKAITFQKGFITPYIIFFLKLLTQRYKLSPLLNHIKGNTSRFGSAIQLLPSYIGKYFCSYLVLLTVVVVFISMFISVIEKCIVEGERVIWNIPTCSQCFISRKITGKVLILCSVLSLLFWNWLQ